MTRLFRISAVCVLWILCESASSEIFRWTDANGKVHFSDRPPIDAQTEKIELRINTYEGVSYDKSIFTVEKKQVVIYSTTWCGVCQRAKRYFKAKNIPYKEYDVEKSQKGKADFRKMGGRGVPVILVGKQRMNGFDELAFQRLYK